MKIIMLSEFGFDTAHADNDMGLHMFAQNSLETVENGGNCCT